MKQRFQISGTVPKAVSQIARMCDPFERRRQARRLPWSGMSPQQRKIALAAVQRGKRAIEEIAGA